MTALPEVPQSILSRPVTPPRRMYGSDFWLSYIANALLLMAISVLFRYADFVIFFGGSERQLGMIVGVGMIGALAGRVFLGVGIDRYGPRRIWLFSLALFVISMGLHLLVSDVQGPLVFAARIMMMTGIAGAVGSAFTYISLRVAEPKIAEIVGILGTSGFLGMAVGPVFGDLLFQDGVVTQTQVSRMFGLAALLATFAMVSVAFATRTAVRVPRRSTSPPLWKLVRRYQPGVVLLVAAALGVAVELPRVFLRIHSGSEYSWHYGVLLVYASVAIVVRVATRHLPERIGLYRVILIGMMIQAASMLLYLTVYHPWQLAIPAMAAGAAHAVLFPSIVAAGAISFPTRYRGLATTLMFGMLDVGNLIGQPAIGNTLYYAQRLGLPRYPTMFIGVAVMTLLVTIVFALRRTRTGSSRLTSAIRS